MTKMKENFCSHKLASALKMTVASIYLDFLSTEYVKSLLIDSGVHLVNDHNLLLQMVHLIVE